MSESGESTQTPAKTSGNDFAIGTRIDRYVLGSVLGSGACGVVYDATHRATGRHVALKTLRPEYVGSDVMRARFRREMRVLGSLHNANLVDAIDAGTLDDGTPFLVLEKLNGRTLASLLDDGPLELASALEVIQGLLGALAVLHAEGIVHRDLKPANIVLHQSATGPVVKLLDLGVCTFIEDLEAPTPRLRPGKLTGGGLLVGTPCYMAPEQIDGRSVDARTDVYGTGVVLYECLTGRTPFEADTTVDVVDAVQHRPVMPPSELRPDCPHELETLVLHALERDVKARAQSCLEFSRELAAVATKNGFSTGQAALAPLLDPPSAPVPLALRDPLPTMPEWTAAARAGAHDARNDEPVVLPTRGRGRWIGALILGAVILAAGLALAARRTTEKPLHPAGEASARSAATTPPASAATTPPASAATTPPASPWLDTTSDVLSLDAGHVQTLDAPQPERAVASVAAIEPTEAPLPSSEPTVAPLPPLAPVRNLLRPPSGGIPSNPYAPSDEQPGIADNPFLEPAL